MRVKTGYGYSKVRAARSEMHPQDYVSDSELNGVVADVAEEGDREGEGRGGSTFAE